MMAQVHGSCDSRFKKVERLLQSYINSGEELGASFVVNINGENVVDIWGGYADKDRTRLWERDTITTVWSTTKCITSLAALILIDRGLLSPYEKVSKYWPEFATNGKQDVEVRHLLSHSSGLSGWEAPVTLSDVFDVPKATALLAEQAPWWTPGTASGYHAFTMGHLVGELVRRVTGKTLGQFISEDMAGPLAADFQLGAQEKDWPRVAETVPPPPMDRLPMLEPTSVAVRTFRNAVPDATAANTNAWKKTEMGAANGHGNARSVAKLLSTVSLSGQVDGKQLLSQKTIDLIFEEQFHGVDLVMGTPVRLGMGFAMVAKDTMCGWLPEGRICGWGGWGGSIGLIDLDRRMTISYVMNKMENSVEMGNYRCQAYVKAVYEALGNL
ncbi:Beta-lactamase [Lasiodiplodia theobromae]|uniref:Beta-lactamase n=1 Tax=Lasiodiplodia theobromae TaxID=45133 RepID=UPI0015C40830|nr:Beta-lactamase [Lasiodiplodia theobromae]KAF4537647.1 Beta-lactamase [Lasiodiplodia theobromae]